MKIENVERAIIFGCCFLLCFTSIQALIIYSLLGILPISQILIVEISLVLALVCLLGCSVYHVQMWRDANSDTSLLNNLYTITAVIMQVQSVLLCGQIFTNILCPNNKTVFNYVTILLWFSRVLNFFHMIILTVMNVFRQYKPAVYLNISVDPRGKWIILSTESILSFLIISMQVWTGCFMSTECLMSRVVRIFGPIVLIVCVLLLLKVTEDGYGLCKRAKKALATFCLRKQNLVVPLNHDLENAQVQIQPIIVDQVKNVIYNVLCNLLVISFRMTLARSCSWSP